MGETETFAQKKTSKLMFLCHLIFFLFLTLNISAQEYSTEQISKIFTGVAKKAISALVFIEADSNHGSGFFITSDGTIMTNAHLVSNSAGIKVLTFDKHVLPAKMIKLNPQTDLAILKVEGTEFPFLPFGNSDELEIGELVLSTGYSLQVPSLALAMVNATSVHLGLFPLEDFILTKTMTTLGNSGGPLLNAKGQVVGITTVTRIAERGGYSGDTFSISSNLAIAEIQKIH